MTLINPKNDRRPQGLNREIPDIWLERFIVGAVTFVIIIRSLYLIHSGWDFITDDAYISFRYARNLAEGAGPVFNPGKEPVEGYTNPLWVGLAALYYRLGLDAIFWIRVTSCAALFGTCLLTYHIARRWTGPILAILPAYALSARSISAPYFRIRSAAKPPIAGAR